MMTKLNSFFLQWKKSYFSTTKIHFLLQWKKVVYLPELCLLSTKAYTEQIKNQRVTGESGIWGNGWQLIVKAGSLDLGDTRGHLFFAAQSLGSPRTQCLSGQPWSPCLLCLHSSLCCSSFLLRESFRFSLSLRARSYNPFISTPQFCIGFYTTFTSSTTGRNFYRINCWVIGFEHLEH